MKISTKDEFLRLSKLGLTGNQLPSWDTAEEAAASGYSGDVMIRYREVGSPWMRPNIPLHLVPFMIDGMVAAGAVRSKFYLTWMSPYVGRLLNAEAWQSPTGLYINYSHKQTHLRESLETDGREATGLAALMVLRRVCCPNSLDDLEALWDRYPDAVIELTAFAREIGSIPGRNTVIWEVRDY